MPKLTAEAAFPKNLLGSLVVVIIFAVYGKHVDLVERGWIQLLKLLPVVIVVGVALVFAQAHRRRRVVVRTLYWFRELRRAEDERRESEPRQGSGTG